MTFAYLKLICIRNADFELEQTKAVLLGSGKEEREQRITVRDETVRKWPEFKWFLSAEMEPTMGQVQAPAQVLQKC